MWNWNSFGWGIVTGMVSIMIFAAIYAHVFPD